MFYPPYPTILWSFSTRDPAFMPASVSPTHGHYFANEAQPERNSRILHRPAFATYREPRVPRFTQMLVPIAFLAAFTLAACSAPTQPPNYDPTQGGLRPPPAGDLMTTERGELAAEDQKRAEQILQGNDSPPRSARYREKPLRPVPGRKTPDRPE